MSVYSAQVVWNCDDSEFIKRRYSREHKWLFDGGIEVTASASPHIVPLPMSSEQAVDPEEAFVAALSSCHMLFFLDYASREGVAVVNYCDRARGIMERNSQGNITMNRVILNPEVTYDGTVPERAVQEALHHKAHGSCFLANSVKTRIEVNIY